MITLSAFYEVTWYGEKRSSFFHHKVESEVVHYELPLEAFHPQNVHEIRRVQTRGELYWIQNWLFDFDRGHWVGDLYPTCMPSKVLTRWGLFSYYRKIHKAEAFERLQERVKKELRGGWVLVEGGPSSLKGPYRLPSSSREALPHSPGDEERAEEEI